ncbi:hypothetical protein CRP01_25415 [Flavilitoribacter nigricans DSM 23189 = NBRC 102662]|uniref:Uncharacterized protein n=1 Tax=Flavilitoribacter nigricans (strain ATCC 23147 / DSM 23189 / NBRC 102662 / NCIMB 1420 / SS-2) TaxID=1122177 RepID=A0A2D0N4Z1_FLAN2|nr:hypothetical protein CRP01_25415 [Flavilitoribacter nigricans DSM 23189 = NBRC 102662]
MFRWVAFGCSLLLSISLSAQAALDLRINATIKDQPIASVLEAIEGRHPVRFFFKADELPARKINTTFTDTRLEDALKEMLSGTPVSFFLYRDGAVIIAPEWMINEVFSANYYKALEESISGPETQEAEQKEITIGDIAQLRPSGKATVQGTVVDAESGEPIIGATILWTELGSGTATDADGSFSAELPTGKLEMKVQYVGYQEMVRQVTVLSDGELNIKLNTEAVNLQEILVRADAPDDNVESAQIGVARLDVQEIKKLPALLGEVDVVNSLLLYPGVSTVGEGASGFNVRGGEVDQNLILQDDGFIFNVSHALGFFSTFNADLISSVELYKGNIPAQFGGRLSSVLDVEMRDGDYEDFHLKGSIGAISSKISLEGPVIKGTSSFIGGFRSSYTDWILKRIDVPEVQKSSAFFYDANFRYSHRLNDKNTLTLAAYSAQDEFTYNEDFGFEYGTQMGQFILRSIFNDNFYSRFSFTASKYTSSQFDFGGLNASRLDNDLSYFKFKEQLTLTPREGLKLDAGISSVLYQVDPGSRSPYGAESQLVASSLEDEKGLESAAFANAEWEVSPALLVSAGLRFSLYQFLGPQTVFEYQNGIPTNAAAIIDSTRYDGGTIASYSSLEPRVSMRYRINSSLSVKAGYSRTSQFINQIFNSASPTPTSQWQLSTNYIQPNRSHNMSFGVFKNFNDNIWETSAEVFYRAIDQLYDYKDFAQLTVNEHLETELRNGVGRAYGLELSVKKKEGTVNGWISYTYSRSERQIEGINKGDWYPSNFDIPHDLSLVVNYQPNQRNTLTFNFNFSKGRPATFPLGNYETLRGSVIPIYSERNQIRIPDYHRLDVAYTLGKGYNKTKKIKTSWTISVYNVYGRKNAFSVFFTQGPFQGVQANKLSILGSAFPSVTLNIELL